jgi:hypothetical protein
MTIKEWILEIGRSLKMLFGVIQGLFEAVVELAWWLFAAYMWITAFTLPLAAGLIIISMWGLIPEPGPAGITSFSFQTVLAVIIILSMPYFYIYNVRKQKVSTSYKFFCICTFFLGGALLENGIYKYYVEHCRAGITRIHAVDAQTKDAIGLYSVSDPKSEWGNEYFKGRGGMRAPAEGIMEVLWMGCEPVTSMVWAKGYETKTIVLSPDQFGDRTVELKKAEK